MFIYHQEGWWDQYKYRDKYKFQSMSIKSHLSGNSSSSDTNNKVTVIQTIGKHLHWLHRAVHLEYSLDREDCLNSFQKNCKTPPKSTHTSHYLQLKFKYNKLSLICIINSFFQIFLCFTMSVFWSYNIFKKKIKNKY